MPGSPSCASPRPARCGRSSWTSPGAATSGLRRRPSGPRWTRPARLRRRGRGVAPARTPARTPPGPPPGPLGETVVRVPARPPRAVGRCTAARRSSCWPRCRPCSLGSPSAARAGGLLGPAASPSAATRSATSRGVQLRAVRDGDRLHIRQGLTDLRSSSVPLHRIQAVEVRQPLSWQATGWWRIEVNVAGVGPAPTTATGAAARRHPRGGAAGAHRAAARHADSAPVLAARWSGTRTRPTWWRPSVPRWLDPLELAAARVCRHAGRAARARRARVPVRQVVPHARIQSLRVARGRCSADCGWPPWRSCPRPAPPSRASGTSPSAMPRPCSTSRCCDPAGPDSPCGSPSGGTVRRIGGDSAQSVAETAPYLVDCATQSRRGRGEGCEHVRASGAARWGRPSGVHRRAGDPGVRLRLRRRRRPPVRHRGPHRHRARGRGLRRRRRRRPHLVARRATGTSSTLSSTP